ncbi:MAG: signal peptidase II [Patescibacteria group bacterium]
MFYLKNIAGIQKKLFITLISIFIIIGIFAIDRILKTIFINRPVPQSLFSGFLEFTKHENYGLIANLDVAHWPVICFSSAVIILLFFVLRQSIEKNNVIQSVAFSLIIGGALGNLYDRIILGYVFDWILLFRTSIINLADLMIFFGLLLYATSIKRNISNQKTKDT